MRISSTNFDEYETWAEQRSDTSEETLREIGRKKYHVLEEPESWALHKATPGDLRVILESASQEPPNAEMIVAVSAICHRTIHCSETDPSPLMARYYEIGKEAMTLLTDTDLAKVW
jgi:hypothetical protein